MKKIIQQIEAAIGDVLKEKGLRAVYDQADDISTEDDIVYFVAADGARSLVYLQVNSYSPSIATASVNLLSLDSRDLPVDGWKIVKADGSTDFPSDGTAEGLLSTLRATLIEHGSRFDLSYGGHGKVMTHPRAGELFDAIGEFVRESGTDLKISPFIGGDGEEGFDLVSGDSRTARIELLPGKYLITVGGEQSVIDLRLRERCEMTKAILSQGMVSSFRM